MKFEIDGGVLKSCQLEEGETTVVAPEGVTQIGEDALRGCKGLESIVIPEGVTQIRESASNVAQA